MEVNNTSISGLVSLAEYGKGHLVMQLKRLEDYGYISLCTVASAKFSYGRKYNRRCLGTKDVPHLMILGHNYSKTQQRSWRLHIIQISQSARPRYDKKHDIALLADLGMGYSKIASFRIIVA